VVCVDPFREGVVEMLSLAGDIEVAAEAATLAVVSEYGPDVMLLDLEMSDGMGADEPIGCIQALLCHPGWIFTMHDEPGMLEVWRRPCE
jgi:DNA-binding NarL/FixJ family response regulator